MRAHKYWVFSCQELILLVVMLVAVFAASNFPSTQDDVAAHLARDHGISTFAIQGAPPEIVEQPQCIGLQQRLPPRRHA